MDNNLKMFMKNMVEVMKKYNEEKKKEGFIPTIDLWIEEMEEAINKENEA